MDDTQAHTIISSLADGFDPTTGEKVDASVLQQGDVIRALHVALRVLEKRPRRNGPLPANAGKPWTEQEDHELLETFDAGQSMQQLAVAHDRTLAGIHARLVRHGRVRDEGPIRGGRGVNKRSSEIDSTNRS